MFALLMCREFGPVVAPSWVWRISRVAALERAVGEADRCGPQVVVEAVREVERLHAVLAPVRRPRRPARAPAADPRPVAARVRERRDREVELAAVARDLLAGVDRVVVVEVRERADVRAAEIRGRGQIAERGQVLRGGGAAERGAGVALPHERVAGRRLDEVGLLDHAARLGVDDRVVDGVAGRGVGDAPCQPVAVEDRLGVVARQRQRAADADGVLHRIDCLAGGDARGRVGIEVRRGRAEHVDDAPIVRQVHAQLAIRRGRIPSTAWLQRTSVTPPALVVSGACSVSRSASVSPSAGRFART